MAAPAGNAWNLARNGYDAVATYVGPASAGANWAAQFRPLGEAAWSEGGGDTLEAALTATFNPWPLGGVEARVRYTDEQGQALSDWSESKPLA
jgi:hypothetical protein